MLLHTRTLFPGFHHQTSHVLFFFSLSVSLFLSTTLSLTFPLAATLRAPPRGPTGTSRRAGRPAARPRSPGAPTARPPPPSPTRRRQSRRLAERAGRGVRSRRRGRRSSPSLSPRGRRRWRRTPSPQTGTCRWCTGGRRTRDGREPGGGARRRRRWCCCCCCAAAAAAAATPAARRGFRPSSCFSPSSFLLSLALPQAPERQPRGPHGLVRCRPRLGVEVPRKDGHRRRRPRGRDRGEFPASLPCFFAAGRLLERAHGLPRLRCPYGVVGRALLGLQVDAGDDDFSPGVSLVPEGDEQEALDPAAASPTSSADRRSGDRRRRRG